MVRDDFERWFKSAYPEDPDDLAGEGYDSDYVDVAWDAWLAALKYVEHDWIPSTLGHGNKMCRRCRITDLEAEALNRKHCMVKP